MRNIALPLTRPGTSIGRTTGQIWNFIASLGLALQVRRERRLLASLDERTLKDLGFNYATRAGLTISIADVKTVRPSYEEIDKGIPEVKELFRDTFGI